MVENNEYRESIIDPTWKVYFFSKTDDSYPAELFAKYGIAFAIINYKVILIDSEQTANLTNDHILAIEAHEISHGRLNHGSRYTDEPIQEQEADWLAHRLLLSMNLDTSANLISIRYKEHYQEDISSLDEYMKQVLVELELG
jgi:hypothetical protein